MCLWLERIDLTAWAEEILQIQMPVDEVPEYMRKISPEYDNFLI